MLLELFVLLLAVVGSQSQVGNTKGKTWRGYTFRQNVEPYLNASLVAGDILNALAKNPPNWQLSKSIYATKRLKTVPAKPIKFYAQARLGEWAGQPFHELYKQYYGKSTTYVDDYIGAFNDKVKVEVVLLWNQVAWMGNQLDNSKIFILTRPKTAAPGVKTQTGGIAEVDDTAGIYTGLPNTPALWEFNANTAAKCGRVSINTRAVDTITAIRAEAIKNYETQARNFEEWDRQYNKFWQIIASGFLRGVLYNAEQQKTQSQARASGFVRIIRPLLKNQKDALLLQTLLSSKTATASVDQVKTYVNQIAAAQGITAADVLCTK